MAIAHVKLTEEEMRALEETAREEGRSVPDLIHSGVEPLLRRRARKDGDEILEAPPDEPSGAHPIFRKIGKIDRRALYRPQTPSSGINAIIGRWPGDESEEEILAALEKLS